MQMIKEGASPFGSVLGSQFLSLTSSVAQTIYISPQQCWANILVPSRRLRILAVLSSVCKETFEGLPNVQCSSTTHKSGRATMPCWQNSKNFHFRSIKGYSVIPCSAFYELPIPNFSHSHSSKTPSTFKLNIYINKKIHWSSIHNLFSFKRLRDIWFAIRHWELVI